MCLSYVLPDGSSMVETNIFDETNIHRLMNSSVYINNVANENAYILIYIKR